MHWHKKDIDTVFREFHSSLKGISEAEAGKRLEQYGRNILQEGKKKSMPAMFLDQFRDFMILILIADISTSMSSSKTTPKRPSR